MGCEVTNVQVGVCVCVGGRACVDPWRFCFFAHYVALRAPWLLWFPGLHGSMSSMAPCVLDPQRFVLLSLASMGPGVMDTQDFLACSLSLQLFGLYCWSMAHSYNIDPSLAV